MTLNTIPHDAHAVLTDSNAFAYCRDCDWRVTYPVIEHPNVLWAWNEAAQARDMHHDTHEKEFR